MMDWKRAGLGLALLIAIAASTAQQGSRAVKPEWVLAHDMAHLDLPFMTAAIQSLVEPMRWLASSNFVPAWNPGGQPVPGNRN